MDTRTPREIDEALAKEHRALVHNGRRASSLVSFAGCVFGTRKGRHGEQGSSHAEIWELVRQAAADGDEYRIVIGKRPSELLADSDALLAERVEIMGRIVELDKLYTGWSRFFLVTSNSGHVHSSMYCHTCYPTTEYGWLPELSGKTEAQAVAKLGDTLCSRCFPSVRVGRPKKIAKAAALKLVA